MYIYQVLSYCNRMLKYVKYYEQFSEVSCHVVWWINISVSG
jgi:uncharacterized membrane protein YagU involved in acid resistance